MSRARWLPREKLLSPRAEDCVLFVFILVFLGGLLLLQMEFPNGLADVHLGWAHRQ